MNSSQNHCVLPPAVMRKQISFDKAFCGTTIMFNPMFGFFRQIVHVALCPIILWEHSNAYQRLD